MRTLSKPAQSILNNPWKLIDINLNSLYGYIRYKMFVIVHTWQTFNFQYFTHLVCMLAPIIMVIYT